MEIAREKRFIENEILFSAMEEELRHGRKVSFTVTGMSMWPFLCHGRDRVILEAVEPEELKVGQVVLFRRPDGGYMMHRITSCQKETMETTGDGNCFRDGRFPKSSVIGRVVTFCRPEGDVDCNHGRWKLLAGLWMMLYPVRPVIFACWRKLRPLVRR